MLITSPTLFICVPSVVVGAGELLEREARPLDDDVVDDRLEGGARARDVVLELVERVADGELRRDLRDGVAGGLDASALERDTRGFISMTWTRPSSGLDRELHVRAARLDADLGHDGARRVAQPLVLAVGQRHRRRDGDRVARVDAHRGRCSRSSRRR
jgi:hypothetical protein